MSSVVISGDTSGAITLSAPAVSGTNTATLPAATGTVMVSGNMPAFSAYGASNQATTSGSTTKLTIDVEVFDTANCFASSRFTPNVAGYYQINGKIRATGTGLTANANLYKNGSLLIIGSYTAATGAPVFSTVTTTVYLNGSTDYIELYGYADTTVGVPTFQAISIGNNCEFSGCLVRGA